MIGSCLGLFLSYWLNLPSGACIVIVLGGIFCLAFLFSPKYGVLPHSRMEHPRRRRRRVDGSTFRRSLDSR